ncbi:transposase [Maribacter arenosus]|uniref:Transposase n=1 Tax=Maribacter arenosus TaxID=1854708 RepID=A0ABR7VG09_9FLAO|nr:transposase [Maribacter arenosus]MBD0851851.1 transposase [Maribacter arenosus]
MEIKEVIGIDVSKLTVDCCIHQSQELKTFKNDSEGISKMIGWSLRKSKVDKENILFVLEHTGLYSDYLVRSLDRGDYQMKIVSGLEIKRSLGIIRGKNDRADSKRIALYGYRTREETLPSRIPGSTLTRLKRLMSMRRKLVGQRAGHMATLREQKSVLEEDSLLFWVQEDIINLLSWRINDLEREMDKLIQGDIELKRMLALLTGIKGIGKVTARFMIVYTVGFTSFSTWRKFASYCGIAPFSHTSGTSVRGRTKVSQLANREGKALLHQCSLSAVKCNPEMKAYYERRLEIGKSKMSTLNIIRNKLVSRAFAVVARGTPYVNTMGYAS